MWKKGEVVCELTPGRPLEVRAGAPARSPGTGARGAGRSLRRCRDLQSRAWAVNASVDGSAQGQQGRAS